MQLEFEKWHGAKNDFIVVRLDGRDDIALSSLRRQAEKLCSQDGTGIGADGILILTKSSVELEIPDSLEIINSDGSIAATCGNGIRCAAASILREITAKRDYDIPDGLAIKLADRSVTCQFLSTQPDKPFVSVDMGELSLNQDDKRKEQIAEELTKAQAELKLSTKLDNWSYAHIGNEHIVIVVDELTRTLLHQLGPRLQKSAHWDGINVHLIKEIDQSAVPHSSLMQKTGGQSIGSYYEALVWERGAGPTAACGSGACAIGAAVLDQGFDDREDWLGVKMPGSVLLVRQRSSEDACELAGPTELVFTGTLEL